MRRRLLRHDLGQAALDYLTVLTVVGIVLAAGTGVAMARGGAIAGAVTSQMARALCIVSGGDCDRDREPCVVGSKETTSSIGAQLLIVRLGASRSVLLAERSDGRVDVVLVDGVEGGLDRSLGRAARLAALARAEVGMGWTVDSMQEAKELVDRVGSVSKELLRSAAGGGWASDPATVSLEGGVSVALGGGAERGTAKATGRIGRSAMLGARYDRRTGHTTVYLKKADELAGALEGATPLGDADGSLELGYTGTLALELDGHMRPVDLMLLQSGEYDGSFSLPGVAAEVAGYLGVPSRHARRFEVERHLDLTVPGNRGAVEAFLAAMTGIQMAHGPVDGGVVTTLLARRLFRDGSVNARTYEVDTTGASDSLSLGPLASVGKDREQVVSRLLAAMSRGPGGTWRERTDCVSR